MYLSIFLLRILGNILVPVLSKEGYMDENNKSEVARLRRQIVLEYQATQRLFTGFTPTAKHEYLTKRQENIERYHQQLLKIVSPDEAMTIVIEAENDPPSS